MNLYDDNAMALTMKKALVSHSLKKNVNAIFVCNNHWDLKSTPLTLTLGQSILKGEQWSKYCTLLNSQYIDITSSLSLTIQRYMALKGIFTTILWLKYQPQSPL